MNARRHRPQQGFSLVELMYVNAGVSDIRRDYSSARQ